MLTASDGTGGGPLIGGGQLGHSVAISGTTILAGAFRATIKGTPLQGAAYFYGHADLGFAIAAPDRVNPGSRFSTSTIATNNSSATSPAVAVSIAVPAAASFISATATQGACNQNAGVVHCEFGGISGNAGAAKANVTLKALGQGGAAVSEDARILRATPPLSAFASIAINHPPVAHGSRLNVKQGEPTSGTLEASDADGDPLVFSIVTPPKHGSVTINDAHKGVYTYTPNAGYFGADSFTFKVNDGYADSNVASVVTYLANQPPVANDGTLTTDKNTAAKSNLKASDPDGDSLTYSIVAPPGHGSITLDATTGDYTYTPAADYYGADGFTFKANDGQSDSNVASVNITVEGSAPPPSPPPSGNGGGGSFGGLPLLLLATLIAAAAVFRRRKPRTPAARDTRATGHSTQKEKFMRNKWTRIVASNTMVLVIAISAIPLMAQAQPMAASSNVSAKSGYRAGFAMPLPETNTAAQRGTLAPQSSLALLKRANKIAPHAPDSTIKITVGLKLRNTAQLKTFLQKVQNPKSSAYHQWLTPQQFTKLYGPTQAEVNRVVAFLKAHGIKVTRVSANRTLIHTEAKSRVYEHAFAIGINDYSLNGRSFYSTADSPKLPRTIAPLVSNILGFNHGVQMRPRSRLHARYRSGQSPQAAPPASTAYFEPQQIAKAYDWPGITDAKNGAGVSIAILTAETPGVDDNDNYHNFWTSFGLPDHTINVIPIGGPSASGGEPETALDIEWSGAMAPGATLNVYVAADGSSDTFTAMYNRFVTDNNSQVMTTSWGLGESGVPDVNLANEQIFMQAAAQGISMFAASGDNGASDCAPSPGYCPPGPNNADFPSSSEYIAAANGTELTISDTSGTYGNEHAWAGTGGAISQLFDKPAWQTGPGVPADIAKRMNSDMALNAGPLHPYMVLLSGPQGLGYYGVNGTSAVAPILAGLFAIGVSEQPGGASLGQSNSLIYDDVNANSNNYGTDFHDVTSGCNGYLPDGTTLSCATTNWDHPTGWGSPKAKNLLSHIGVHGPAGVLKGTVTDAASGATVAAATVTVSGKGFDESRITTDGSFLFAVPVGNYTVTTTSFGYTDGSVSVSIADGETTTQNIALEPAPTATISGKVSDGSGHGYGLYAEIKASVHGVGQVADVWTDPASGKYSIKLPKGFDYTLNVTAAFNGYQPGISNVNLTGHKTRNFSLKVTDACTAPGYATPFSEDFNTEWPPTGWTVTNTADNAAVIWKPSIKWGNPNWTGGTGLAAQVGVAGVSYDGPYDTSLISAPIAASRVHGDAILHYKANYQPVGLAQALDLDISTDGGKNWTTMLQWTHQQCGNTKALPGCDVKVDLGPYLPAAGDFQLRWHFYNNLQDTWIDRYAQIDDMHIGACQAIAGGLLFGQVTDANTDIGINSATVEDDIGNTVDTTANRADPDFPLGGYLLFVPAGKRKITASNYRYQNAKATFTMNGNVIKEQNFALKAGRLASNPDNLTLHVMVNNQVTRSVKIQNTGSARAHLDIVSVNTPPPVTSGGVGAPLIRIKGSFSPLQSARSRTTPNDVQADTALTPHAAPWQDIENYPLPVWDNGVARDPTTGIVYSVGGTGSSDYYSAVYAYNPATNAWSLATHDKFARESPQVAFIDSQLYVVGGLLSNAKLAQQLEIYDPATGKWSTGADIPTAYYGSGHAVANGNFYIVGGCVLERCASSDVQVYDPATNIWSKAKDYPHPTAFVSCGGLDGKLYCAGGTSSASGADQFYKDAYVYDPTTDQWSPIPDMPTSLWGSSYAAANGALLISGGASGPATLTNIGYAYDPASNGWHNLPPSNYALLRGGSACGFYQIGGTKGGPQQTVTSADVLPSYTQCGKPMPVPWLTSAPKSTTVAVGASKRVKFIFDGTGQEEFTTSHAYVKLQSNTPYPDRVIPLTVTWDPQSVNLVLSGEAAPKQLRKGNELIYTITVYNHQEHNHGAASRVNLAYALPKGAKYETASGDANSCTENNGTVSCDFGTIALGDSKTETLAIKAGTAGKLTSHFKVSAREPESDDSDNSLVLASDVIGTANLALGAKKAEIPQGGTGTLTLRLNNGGPDPASAVQLHAKAESGVVSLRSVSASQGSCTVSGGALSCKLGQVDVGKPVTVKLQLFGTAAGSATINVQASTASEEPNDADNSVSAEVAVTPPPPHNGGDNGGGGGALGWLVLAALLSLACGACVRRRQHMRR
jgi:N-acetylneuraminic acid mutarotase